MEKSYRLFLRNLPADVKNKDLEKLLREHGTATNIDIKEKIQSDGSKIAFVNFSTTDKRLCTCFREVNGAFLRNNAISIDVAKENYLDRMKREREEATKSKEAAKEPQFVAQNEPIERINIKLPKTIKNKPTKRIYNFDEDDDGKTIENHAESANNSADFSYDPALQVETPVKKEIEIKDSIPLKTKAKVEKIEKIQEKKVLSESEIKRLASVKRKVENFRAKEHLISQALKAVDSTSRNNRLVFSDDIDETTVSGGKTSKSLFDDEEEEDHEDWNKDKFLHDEKRSAKLTMSLNNVSRDKRFAIDERFLEDDEKVPAEKTKDLEDENELENETKWQLGILENVLGKPFKARNENFSAKKQNTMIRYDPTSINHRTHELEITEKPAKKAKRQKIAKIEAENEEAPVPVSSQVFYTVSENLTESLKPQDEEFSLLKTFGTATTMDKNRIDDYDTTAIVAREKSWEDNGVDKNPFKYESSDEEGADPSYDRLASNNCDDSKIRTKDSNDTFFFVINDQRFNEAEEFIKMKPSTTNFTNVRRELKQIVRSKIRNNVKKNTPWRNSKIRNKAKVR